MKKIIITFSLILVMFIAFSFNVSAKNISDVELGSYIVYYPSQTSYTVPASNTGTSASTINPSELTSWRVLKVNTNNTVEIISTYVSTNAIKFSGTTGYRYYVNELQNAAKAYINPSFSSSARSFGFNNQTLILPNSGIYDADFYRPWDGTTSNNNNEASGGGDMLYLNDVNQMNTANIPLVATKMNSSSNSAYYIASRRFVTNDRWTWYFDVRFIDILGNVASNGLRNYDGYHLNNPSTSFSLRPVVILNNDLKVTGSGTESDPYKIVLYTISFNSNQGSTVDDKYVYVNNSKISKPTDPTKIGHVFKGWYKDEDLNNLWDFDNDVVTSNTTLYAKWEKEEYNVSFVLNGHGNNINTQKVLYNDKIVEPDDPDEYGYVFKGWYKDEALTDLWDFDNDVVTSSTTLYAKWEKEEYSVSFDTNGHGDSVNSQNVLYNDKVLEPDDPNEYGYIFKGWNKDESLTNLWDFDNDVVTSNTTLYAKWEKEEYSVSFNINGHGDIINEQKVLYNNKVLEPDDLIEEGYVFQGWYKDEALTDLWDFDNDVVTSSTTLYAKWTIAPTTYTYKIVSGNHKSFNKSKADSYVIVIDGDYLKFESFEIIGLTLVENTDYTVTDGNTTITFTASGLAKINTLDAGNYTFNVKYSNGETVSGNLIVTANDVDDSNNTENNTDTTNNPQTSDIIISYIISSIFGTVCLAGGTVYLNRKVLFANR